MLNGTHYSKGCLCKSCKEAGNRRYIGGGVYNVHENKPMNLEEIIKNGVNKFSHYMDWFDKTQRQGHYRMDDDDIREIFYSSIKEILEGVIDTMKEKAERIRLDVNVIVCDCGEPYKESDLDLSVKELEDTISYLEEIIKSLNN